MFLFLFECEFTVVGVKSVAIDQDKGLVTVSGDIDPVLLLQKIKKMGKEAKLWFFQQGPGPDCSTEQSKRAESDRNNEDAKQQFDWHFQHKCVPETMAMKEPDWGPRSLPVMPSNVHGYSYSQSIPRLGYRPTWPYQQPVPSHRLIPPHGYYSQPPLPPPPPAYPYFQPQSPPQANPVMHYTSYADNWE